MTFKERLRAVIWKQNAICISGTLGGLFVYFLIGGVFGCVLAAAVIVSSIIYSARFDHDGACPKCGRSLAGYFFAGWDAFKASDTCPFCGFDLNTVENKSQRNKVAHSDF